MSRLYNSITHERPWSSSAPPQASKAVKQYTFRDDTPPRSHTSSLFDTPLDNSATVVGESAEGESMKNAFKEAFIRSEAHIADLFRNDGASRRPSRLSATTRAVQTASEAQGSEVAGPVPPPKKSARTIDEDNYDDEEEEDERPVTATHSKHQATSAFLSPSKSGSSPINSERSPAKADAHKDDASRQQPKSSEDARKQLEESKKALEDAAKRSFHTIFYTLENDRVAMLEQQKLEESEKQIDAEMDGGAQADPEGGANTEHGTLSSANLGASSLTLKHLIARIDVSRHKVHASDLELRNLINEVRKNRSKWASEENVNQEELYEACDKVLSELKALTEYSTPFLTRVNKREAPDYYNIIKHPMDFGTMTKKLKNLQYKSKADFVADLDLIWSNCMLYNGAHDNPFRKKALALRKESEKLVPLIPDLVVRSRAEVEAEERRKQNGGDDDMIDDSDDEPIMSSRGRKTASKGATKARKAIPDTEQGTPGVEQKPTLQVNGLIGDPLRQGSEMAIDGSQNGFGTPPIGNITPSGAHGPGSHSDDLDGPSLNGLGLGQSLGPADDYQDDEQYKIWKQVTKKDRALVAKERNLLFKGDKLNVDEPALLRTKAGMRRWIRQKQQGEAEAAQVDDPSKIKEASQGNETLAEGMDGELERVLPDYYDALSAIPDIPEHLLWNEDTEGNLRERPNDRIHMVPAGHFTAPKSQVTTKIDANMKQMQETRKLCSKIGVIKQMQLQAQMYNNQFPKYDPEPFLEADIEPHVTYDDGPIMSPWVCRAAMQRSVSKICYHAGFEELQPSALDVISDMAGEFFHNLAHTFNVYREAPKIPAAPGTGQKFAERFTPEEVVLHSLGEHGIEIDMLETYVTDDIERLGSKLVVMHDRMKAHLTELLRPALQDTAGDGSGAFNDGSEQFVGGDFAEELGEDFFGFKALGLDSEFGMSTLSVPLHLLQTRLHSTYTGPVVVTQAAETLAALPPLSPVTKDNVQLQIGLVKNFFLAKLRANEDEPLVEDEDLTGKQKPVRPRLGPTGKILVPRKRPIAVPQAPGSSKKKKKLDNGVAMDPATGHKMGSASVSPEKAKRLKDPSAATNGVAVVNGADKTDGQSADKDDGPLGMMSPESIERA